MRNADHRPSARGAAGILIAEKGRGCRTMTPPTARVPTCWWAPGATWIGVSSSAQDPAPFVTTECRGRGRRSDSFPLDWMVSSNEWQPPRAS